MSIDDYNDKVRKACVMATAPDETVDLVDPLRLVVSPLPQVQSELDGPLIACGGIQQPYRVLRLVIGKRGNSGSAEPDCKQANQRRITSDHS